MNSVTKLDYQWLKKGDVYVITGDTPQQGKATYLRKNANL